jgi:hypothetical protein
MNDLCDRLTSSGPCEERAYTHDNRHGGSRLSKKCLTESPKAEVTQRLHRGRCVLATAYDVKGGSQFRTIMQFLRQIHPPFSDLTAMLTDLLRKSQPQKVTLTHACLEAFETLKLRLIYAPCPILPEVSSDVTFTGATYASTLGIATVSFQDQGGGLQLVSYLARKLNLDERGNTYSAYDLKALAVCKAVKHWRCYLEGLSKFLVVIDHDTLRHLRRQTNTKLN